MSFHGSTGRCSRVIVISGTYHRKLNGSKIYTRLIDTLVYVSTCVALLGNINELVFEPCIILRTTVFLLFTCRGYFTRNLLAYHWFRVIDQSFLARRIIAMSLMKVIRLSFFLNSGLMDWRRSVIQDCSLDHCIFDSYDWYIVSLKINSDYFPHFRIFRMTPFIIPRHCSLNYCNHPFR